MKQFIKSVMFIAVLAVITMYSNTITNYVLELYNNSINYLGSNLLNIAGYLAY